MKEGGEEAKTAQKAGSRPTGATPCRASLWASLEPQDWKRVSLTRKKEEDISGLGPTRETPFSRRKLMAPKVYQEPTIPSPALSSSCTPGTQASLGFPENAGPTRHRALPPTLSRLGPACFLSLVV